MLDGQLSGLRFLGVASLLLLVASRAWGVPSAIALPADADRLNVTATQVAHLADPSELLTVENVRLLESSAFTAAPRDMNFGYISGNHWLRLWVHNPSSTARRWVLASSYPPIDAISFWDVSSPEPRELLSGDMLPFSSRAYRGLFHGFPIELGPGETHLLLLRLRSASNVKIPLVFWNPEHLAQTESAQSLGYGLLIGLLLTLTVYNLFHFALLRDRSYLYFSAYMLSTLLFLSAQGGFAQRFLWPDAFGVTNLLALISGIASCVVHVAFLRQFLSTSQHHRYVDRALKALLIFSLGTLATAPLLPFALASQLGLLLLAAFPFFSIPAAASSVRRGFTPARYLLWAHGSQVVIGSVWSVSTMVPALARAIGGETFVVVALTLIGAEAVLLSFALGARMNVLEEERSRLRGAQDRMQQLMDTAGEALVDVSRWARRFASELAPVVGSKDIAVWAVSGLEVTALHEGSSRHVPPTREEFSVMNSPAREPEAGELRVPVRGPTGDLLGGIFIHGAQPNRWGDSERRLIGSFAHQLGMALELRTAQQSLIEAQTRRASSRKQMIEKWISLLRFARIANSATRIPWRSASTIAFRSKSPPTFPIGSKDATDSSRSWARGEWVQSIELRTNGSCVKSRSRCCGRTFWPTRWFVTDSCWR